jgi:hypothetical protein
LFQLGLQTGQELFQDHLTTPQQHVDVASLWQSLARLWPSWQAISLSDCDMIKMVG